MGGRGRTASGRRIGVAGFEALHAVDDGQPLAVPRDQLAGCLGHQVDPGKLAAAVAAVRPYFTAAGEPVWSLHLLKLELGLVRRPRRNHARVQVGGRWEQAPRPLTVIDPARGVRRWPAPAEVIDSPADTRPGVRAGIRRSPLPDQTLGPAGLP